LLRNFIEQWSHTPSSESAILVSGTDWTLNWQHELPGAKFFHRVVLTTAGIPQDTKAALLRTMGHFILSRIPEEGLTEALESLAETYNYWLTCKYNTIESGRPVSSFYEAGRGSSYVRPKFHVPED
jgi:hypothetical protein